MAAWDVETLLVMTLSAAPAVLAVAPGTVAPAAAPTATPAVPSMGRGVVAILTAGASNQVGAAVGAQAFPVIGPAGVVAVRQLIAAAVLLPLVRPRFWRYSWAQWWPGILLAFCFSGMNLTLYLAIDRIGLGLAVTLEFLGPLAVALAGSRRLVDLGCALAAGAGVYLMVLPGGSTDVLGVGLGLIAAACWAGYILLNRVAGRRLPGVQAAALSSGLSALLYLPVAVLLLHAHLGDVVLLYAVAAGVLASVVPMVLDLLALRRVPAQFFSIFMSAHPVFAVIAGVLLLAQVPAGHELAGIGIVVLANVVAVTTLTRSRVRR